MNTYLWQGNGCTCQKIVEARVWLGSRRPTTYQSAQSLWETRGFFFLSTFQLNKCSVTKYSLALKSSSNKPKETRFTVWLPSCSLFQIINNLPLGYQRGYNLRKQKRWQRKCWICENKVKELRPKSLERKKGGQISYRQTPTYYYHWPFIPLWL